MLATILLDTFAAGEAGEIAAALDDLCSPDDTYGFASVGLYAFWSVPGRDILYVGLAGDLRQRFRQHAGLVACDPDCCKRPQIEAYFRANARLGYSALVQSPMEQPPSAGDRAGLVEQYGDAFADEIAAVVRGDENVRHAEGVVLELHRRLGDRLPPWNKIHGSRVGRERLSLASVESEVVQGIVEMLRAGSSPGGGGPTRAERTPPYELLLNLTGYELSGLNAKATLREIAASATYGCHEEFLHGVRMLMVEHGYTFEQGLTVQLAHNPFAPDRVRQMRGDGYLDRVLKVPGLP